MDKKEIKQQILNEIKKAESLIADYQEMTKPIAPDDAIGRVSRMDAINNKSVTESVLRQAKEKLSKLRYALSKVEQTDFGLCMKCNSPIPLGRILIKPESMLCVNCAH